jgi:hypothetical protein
VTSLPIRQDTPTDSFVEAASYPPANECRLIGRRLSHRVAFGAQEMRAVEWMQVLLS